MRIAINLRQFYKGRIGGQEHYLVNVIRHLDQAGHALTIFTSQGEFESVRAFAPHATLLEPGPEREGRILQMIREDRFDLLFCPLLVLEPLDPPIPSAVMMPDLQHEFHPEFFPKAELQWRRRTYLPSAVNASVVLTPSEFTKRTVVERFNVSAEKVDAFPHDVDAEFRQPRDPRAQEEFQRLGLPEKYLYFPSNFWQHKNHSTLLRALKLVHSGGFPDLHLVFTGASGADSTRVKQETGSLGLSGRVSFLGYQERALIPEIYRHSLGLVFATRFEGMGLPVIEAMCVGVPVITSKGGAAEEIAGGEALLVDEKTPEGIAAGILELLSSPTRRDDLIARGLRRGAEFSWERYNQHLDEIFEKITSPGFMRPAPIEVSEYPGISVVTPSFNMAPYIEETIQSVLTQEYPKLDYLVMDACSTDGTVEILRKYEGRIRWKSEPDKGQADAVNKGFLETSGEVFAFLNADDTYRPGALATVGEAFRKNPHVGMVYGEAFFTNERGEILERYQTLPWDYDVLNQQCFICQPAAFLSREAFEHAGMLDASLQYSLDYDLWMRVGAENQVLKLPAYLANWRMYEQIKSLRDRGKVYKEAFRTVYKYFHYLPPVWLNAYACYLIDRKDQFFHRSLPTHLSHLLSLYLGLRKNPGQRKRYFSEWANYAGLAGAYTGLWEDGWVSRKHRRILKTPADADSIRIEGRHASPFYFPLQMDVYVEGRPLGTHTMNERGPFRDIFPLPRALRGRDVRLELRFNNSWQPGSGDYRYLSCVIDTIVAERNLTE
jgi:glycosyltransferase involved in cell wall biosynthesis